MHTYTYDAEGRINTVDNSTQYYYDAQGVRFAKGAVGQTPTTDFLYDLDGHLITTVGADYKLVRTSLYVAGHHWADYTAGTGTGGGRTEYRLSDQVGAFVYKFDQSGNLIEQCTSRPFGEDLSCNQSVDYSETHFADAKRDQESNLDYMGARYYSSSMGRFMSPDPSGLAYADQTNPQSLNLYAYALNNPLKYTDPTGLYCYYGDTNANSADWGDDSQYDMHSTQSECTAKDENGNRGTWFNDPSTTVNVNADGSSSTIDTTLPTSNAYITPVAQPARDKLLSTLSNANPCWAFFNAATSSSGMGSPGQTFANTDVRLDPTQMFVSIRVRPFRLAAIPNKAQVLMDQFS